MRVTKYVSCDNIQQLVSPGNSRATPVLVGNQDLTKESCYEEGYPSRLRGVHLCDKCHPFYTGQQQLVDTGGRVQRFADKFGGAAAAQLKKAEEAKAARAAKAAEEAAAKKAAREAKAAEKAKRAAEYAKKAEAEAAKQAAEEPAAEEQTETAE